MTLSISCSQFYFPEFALKPRLLPNAQPGFLDRLKPGVMYNYPGLF